MQTNDSLSYSGADRFNQEGLAELLAELGTRLLNGGVREVVVAVDQFFPDPSPHHSHTATCRCLKPKHGPGQPLGMVVNAPGRETTVSVSFRLVDSAISVPVPAEGPLPTRGLPG